jgi:transcriptional regulator with GAF, ATPase, and Fis domain
VSSLGLIASNAKRRAVFHQIEIVAPIYSAVVIRGENSIGKEVIAEAIYAASPLSQNRFVAVIGVAIPSVPPESELFGSERSDCAEAVTQTTRRLPSARCLRFRHSHHFHHRLRRQGSP